MDPVGIPENCLNFSFGLDNANFSDRILLLEIVNANTARGRHADPLAQPTAAPREKTIYINSLILAARSPFFLKLFSNGMLESEQKHVKLQIEATEEASFMDLLKYFYSNNLPTTLDAVLDLWIIANKYEVETCLRECSRSLQNLPMTCESATLCLDLSPTLLMSPSIQPLIDKANQFLVEHYKDFDRCEEEMLDLSLPCIQAVLSSDDLQVGSESDVYSFVLKWVRKNYSDVEERREILKTNLLNLVRFPFMTTSSLIEEVLTCSEIDHELASTIVIRALHFKVEAPHRRSCLAAGTKTRQYVERAYQSRQSIAYLQLAKKELSQLMRPFPNDEIRLESFFMGGIELELSFVRCESAGQPTSIKYLWLGVKAVKSVATFEVKYEISTRKKASQEFEKWEEGSITFTETGRTKYIFIVLWTDFISEEKCFFINDIFHLRAEFTMIKKD